MSRYFTVFLATIMASMIFVLTSGVISAQPDTGTQDEQAPESNGEQQAVVQAEFEDPMSVEEVSRLAEQNDAEVSEVEGEFKVGSETFQDGYVASPGETAEQIRENYAKRRLGSLDNQIETEKSQSNNLKQSKSQTAAIKKVVREDTLGPVRVDETTLSGAESDLQELVNEQEDVISESELITEEEAREAQQKEAETAATRSLIRSSIEEPTFFAQAATPNWVPDYGSTVVRKVTSRRAKDPIGTPYAHNRFIWYNDPGFGRYEPYEHDFFLYNRDGKTLMRKGQTAYPACLPNIYFRSNYPESAEDYLDSRALAPNDGLGCETDLKAYTVGALRADKLQANKVYQVFVSTGKTNVNRDRWLLQAQKQRRSIGCITTFCITSKATTTLVPYGSAPEDGFFW